MNGKQPDGQKWKRSQWIEAIKTGECQAQRRPIKCSRTCMRNVLVSNSPRSNTVWIGYHAS
eukprot:6563064-Karenia_brevis.AAC.1